MAGKAGRRHWRAGQSSSTARQAATARDGASLGGKSYEELYVEHAPAARLVALSLVPADVADDIVADAFVRVLAAIRVGGGPDRAFRGYLLTAVRNLAYDWLAARRRVTVLGDLGEEAGDLVAGCSSGAEAQAEARAEARLILSAFSRLPERWRTVLWHLEVEGKSPADVAPAFGLSPNGVSALAMRAREGLRQAYLQEHIGTNIPAACRVYAAELGAGTRGRLSPRRQAAMQEHLRQCPACTDLFTELSELNGKLGTILAPVALAGASAVLHSGRHAALRTALSAQSRSWRWHPVTAVTGAAAGVAVAGGMIFAVNITPVTGSPPHVTVRPADPHGAASGPAAGKTAPGRHRGGGGGGGGAGTPAGSGIPAVSPGGSPGSPAGLARPPALAAAPQPSAPVTGLASAAATTVTGLADTASTATAGLSDAVSTAVTGLGQTASTAVTGATSTAAATVSGITSTAAASTTTTVAATVTGATSITGATAANLASTTGSTAASPASTAANTASTADTTASTADTTAASAAGTTASTASTTVAGAASTAGSTASTASTAGDTVSITVTGVGGAL